MPQILIGQAKRLVVMVDVRHDEQEVTGKTLASLEKGCLTAGPTTWSTSVEVEEGRKHLVEVEPFAEVHIIWNTMRTSLR